MAAAKKPATKSKKTAKKPVKKAATKLEKKAAARKKAPKTSESEKHFRECEKTWGTFLKFSKISILITVVILILMALFLV